MKVTNLDDKTSAAVLLEYESLREEILKRIELRQQFVSITLTLAAVFLGVGLGTQMVALIFPPIAAILALAWNQNEFRIRKAANYIRKEIESRVEGLHWETYVNEERREQDKKSFRERARYSLVLSNLGVFLSTQIIAVIIGLLGFIATPVQGVLLGLDALSIVFVIWVVYHDPDKPRIQQI
jgi:hypothetical protein